MRKPFLFCFLLSVLATFAAPGFAAPAAGIDLYVREPMGIRRGAYPVNARVPFAKGELKDPSNVRLMLNDREIAVQVAAESRWPDNSIKWLDVDFNATIGPLEQQLYRVEFGDEVKPAAKARGLTVSDGPDSIQVGSVHFGRTGSPLVLSVGYRQEDIAKEGANGFAVVDDKGMSHMLTADSAKVEIVKPGPIYVEIRYTGKVTIEDAYSVPFALTLEMTSGKTWVKYTASVDDPAKRVRSIQFASPIAFGPLPWLWDFGTGSWTYGSFRNASDTVTLTQVVKPGADDWKVENGPEGKQQLYETAAGYRPKIAEGWGHFQDGKEVIAFGFDKFGRQPGTYSVKFDGHGQESFAFTAAQPGTHHELAIYQHYVASPTPIGAVTSPVSMLHGLTAVCGRAQYVKSGVPVPADVVVSKKP